MSGVDVIYFWGRAWWFDEVNRDCYLPHHSKRFHIVVPARIVTVEPATAYRAAKLSTVIRDTLPSPTASEALFFHFTRAN